MDDTKSSPDTMASSGEPSTSTSAQPEAREHFMAGVREKINQHRRATAGIVVAVVALVSSVIVMQVLAGRRAFPTSAPEAFFSVDDGQTFFAASSENVAPFDFQGKQAVRAYVFECAGKRFVGYVERYTIPARATLINEKKSTPELQIHGRELKKPGEATWVSSGDFAAIAKVTDVRCPDGRAPEPVEP
jgi:hypothetical protein